MAQREKNLPAVREIWIQSLGWGDPLEEEGHDNPLQYSCLENPHEQRSRWATVHGVAESHMTEQLSTQTRLQNGVGLRRQKAKDSVSYMNCLSRTVIEAAKKYVCLIKSGLVGV